MRSSKLFLLCLALSAMGPVSTAQVPSPTNIEGSQIVLGREKGYLLAPAANVFGSKVESWALSPDGRYIVGLRVPVGDTKDLTNPFYQSPQVTIAVADLVSGKVTQVGTIARSEGGMFFTFVDDQVAILRLFHQVNEVYIVSELSVLPATAEVHKLAEGELLRSVYNKADHCYYALAHRAVARIDMHGNTLGQMAVPVEFGADILRLSADKSGFATISSHAASGSGRKPLQCSMDFAKLAGHFEAIPQPVADANRPRPGYSNVVPELTFSYRHPDLGPASPPHPISSVWLIAQDDHKKELGRGFLGEVTNGGIMLKGQEFVLLERDKTLWLIRISEAPLAVCAEVLAERARTAALNQAKQIGISLWIFLADGNDALPKADHWTTDVMPYLKDQSLTTGFVYLLDGESMSSFKDPATTQLGYVETPYGRAVVFVDGHAKFFPNS